ncbi:MAG: group 1 truncated hemoglobin [Blastocatellia bacterium]|nr:group 1 truncated hemoglobin [Blastocatellia bacterium]MBL8192662.1 group 1 truncated hemoglobin [Blastocatellia bacterium]MBN8723782.1 group 1 truncated hemoglobin [Acidobacteriota bacterium]
MSDNLSIYEQIGGKDAVNVAVENFYRKVLTDERICHFFDDIDMDKQMAKQAGFLTMVLGGPNEYTGKSMREGHAHLLSKGLNDKHVDVVLELLAETLTELNVPQHFVNQVITTAESTRNDVLSR